MPRDVGGNYTLPAGNPVVPNTIIATNWANTTMQDIADALTASLSIDGSVTTVKIADDAVTRAKLNGLDANGMVAAISATEFEARTITGTSGEVTVTNGDGVAANPTLALATEVYKRANILGTVSQSAGVPTGAIIESGSNANGNYVRYASGLQICYIRTASLGLGGGSAWGTSGATIRSGTSWTFPAAFIDTNIAVAGTGVDNADVGIIAGSIPTATTHPFFYITRTASPSTFDVHFVAVGRWFA